MRRKETSFPLQKGSVLWFQRWAIKGSRVTSAIGHGACKPRDRHWKCKLRLAREDTTRESRKNVLCTCKRESIMQVKYMLRRYKAEKARKH